MRAEDKMIKAQRIGGNSKFEVHSTFTGRMALNRIYEQNLIAIVAVEPYKSAISAFDVGTIQSEAAPEGSRDHRATPPEGLIFSNRKTTQLGRIAKQTCEWILWS